MEKKRTEKKLENREKKGEKNIIEKKIKLHLCVSLACNYSASPRLLLPLLACIYWMHPLCVCICKFAVRVCVCVCIS